MIHVAHVIVSLSIGGAQMMLYKLLAGGDRTRFTSEVLSLTDVGSVGEKIAALGVPVQALGMRRGIPDPLVVGRLAWWLHQRRPAVLQTWLSQADLIGGLAAKLAGAIPVVWNLRHSSLDPAVTRRTTRWAVQACAPLSHWLPNRIIACSEAAYDVHHRLGYAASKLLVIPNGFDTTVFAPDAGARQAIRAELGLAPDALVIGLVGNFDPYKDQQNFVRAAGLLHQRWPSVQFVLCGDRVDWDNPALVTWIEAAGIRQRCQLLGRRDDIPRLTAALDIASSASYREAFPNVIGEAMACAVPCVVTDAGDSARIVGNTGYVVPPKDPARLADAWANLLALSTDARQALGRAARRRVQEHYSLPTVVSQYEALYARLANHPRRGHGPRDAALAARH